MKRRLMYLVRQQFNVIVTSSLNGYRCGSPTIGYPDKNRAGEGTFPGALLLIRGAPWK